MVYGSVASTLSVTEDMISSTRFSFPGSGEMMARTSRGMVDGFEGSLDLTGLVAR